MIIFVLRDKRYHFLSKPITDLPFTGSHIFDSRNCLLSYLTIFYFSASAFPFVAVALFIKASENLEIASSCSIRE